MENPATWGRAEKTVDEALRKAGQAKRLGVYGLSTVRQITDALRAEGLLILEDSGPVRYSMLITESGRMVVHNGGEGMPMAQFLRKMADEIESGETTPERVS